METISTSAKRRKGFSRRASLVIAGLVASALTCTKVAGAQTVVSSAGKDIPAPRTDLDARVAPSTRLVSPAEGRGIVREALHGEDAGVEGGAEARDCSHTVHDIYARAGFTYPYASSFEIYSGDASFARVKYPRAGDVIAWPGHVGIVVNPARHSFYSLVRAGLEEMDYRSVYWRLRGIPRYYRYKLVRREAVTTIKSKNDHS